MEKTLYTPDYQTLDEFHLVLECGPIQKDMPAYGSAFTVEKMALWVTDGQAIPIRMAGATRVRVSGTLYRLDRDQLMALDKRKQNGVWFQRERIRAWYKPETEVFVWFYVGCNEYWEERLRWNLGFREDKRLYKPAPRFLDNDPLFNRAARYSSERIEDHDPPLRKPQPPIKIIEVACKTKNEAEIKRLHDEYEQKQRVLRRAQAPWYKRMLMA